jgi:hypothetical protein
MLNEMNCLNATVNAKLITLVRFTRECGWVVTEEFGCAISQRLSRAWKDADAIELFSIVDNVEKYLREVVGASDRIEKLQRLTSSARTEQGVW